METSRIERPLCELFLDHAGLEIFGERGDECLLESLESDRGTVCGSETDNAASVAGCLLRTERRCSMTESRSIQKVITFS
jgi:hypothetical protein